MTDEIERRISLFDLDGTLCDHDLGLFTELERLRSSDEPVVHSIRDNVPDYVKARADLIRASEDWWANLPKFQLGWDVLGVARELEYRIMILTQGPRNKPLAWSGKLRWIDTNLGKNVDVTITRDKGLVYGKVLVDDYPGYVESWLRWRKNGLVIMPANEENRGYKHPQIIRYDGTNLDQVREAMSRIK
ncbi:MAG: hypothetical protein WC796_02630 [Candidatus Pacearchaeota archaeon]|jgi:hypothetical protein